MKIYQATLKNSGKNINNDVVFPVISSPFTLESNSFEFEIVPKTKFWRFGLRFSKSETVQFFHPEHRYKEPDFNEYKDIHFGAGDFDGNKWQYPDKLHLAQYNFQNLDHLVAQYQDYEAMSPINWFMRYNSGTLELSYTNIKGQTSIHKFNLPGSYKFFNVFAWADSVAYEIDCTVKAKSADNLKTDILAFKVGNLQFRLGDMFDSEVVNRANFTLLPASTNGSATTQILNRASEINIPYPTSNKAGAVKIYRNNQEHETSYFGYGYSVVNTESDLTTISKLCQSILKELKTLNQQINGVNIPLFGTGAGGLKVTEVASVFDKEFNTSVLPPIIVSIQLHETFNSLKRYFEGRYTPLTGTPNKGKSKQVLLIEKGLGIQLDNSQFEVNKKGELTRLNLNGLSLSLNLDLVGGLRNLTSLAINNVKKADFKFLNQLKGLHSLYLINCRITDYSFLKDLPKLNTLDLSENEIVSIEFLVNIPSLRSLTLSNNKVENIDAIKRLSKLEFLDISKNQISNAKSIIELSLLRSLNISSNRIASIAFLKGLINLSIFDFSSNRVISLGPLLDLPNLDYVRASHNPIIKKSKLELDETENHLPIIRSFLLRQAEKNKIQFILPVKVVLLGNHASGKSSLLQYLRNHKIQGNISSTHVIKIERYPASSSKLPEAIFFDFGGQDYYHGIYRAFLSGGSIYLVLWNEGQNQNMQRKDSNGLLTQDFTINYWLSQKKYLENEKFNSDSDPIFLIQSYSDKDSRLSLIDYSSGFRIDNEFYVSLKKTSLRGLKGKVNDAALKYLKTSILEQIELKRVKRMEPLWYARFINYILKQNNTANYTSKGIAEVATKYQRIVSQNKLEYLREDLEQLHRQGLVLYYKKELPDSIWLNPVALAQYVHDSILDKAKMDKFNGRVPVKEFDKFDKEIVKLLCLQKVIFRHEFGEAGEEMIIPNFLPLVQNAEEDFSLFTFGIGNPLFILKFTDFLPFGLINQLICFFGRLPDKKKFWRDQMLFTFQDRMKILIHIDFSNLEIKVYGANKGHEQDESKDIVSYLFYGIIGLYWDLELLDFNDFISFRSNKLKIDDYTPDHPIFKKVESYEKIYQKPQCRPKDLHISIDGVSFVNYAELCSAESQTQIQAVFIDENRNLTNKTRSTEIHLFQAFTNTQLKRRRKVVISYSKKDLQLVDKFKDYLVPLYDDGLIEHPWYCTELIAGAEWNEEIQRRFDDADIIFFMMSENLMSTKYVKENEIKNAIDKWDRSKEIKIVPIILVPYRWSRSGNYNLSRFTALPYTAKPITDFNDQRLAWHVVSESIRIMIERDMQSLSENEVLNAELKSIFERIVEKKLDNNSN